MMARPSLGKRCEKISESVTIKLNSLSQELKKKGLDVINLTAGEPDFSAPEPAKAAAIKAVQDNRSYYTPAAGIPELRSLIAEKTNRQQPDLQKPWTEKNTIVTNGAKHALANLLQVLVDPGEEVVILSPYWLSYPEMVKLADGKPVIVNTKVENGFRVNPQELEAAITSKTKAIVLNSPSNPTGSVYGIEDLRKIGEGLRRHPSVWLLSDEIYDRICFDPEGFQSFLSACPDLQDQVITVNGMSKSGAMTGWRVGWAVGREDLISAMGRLQGQTTSNVNALAQWASVACLQIPESEFSSQIESYRRRRDLALDILSKNGKIKISVPNGAFYLFLGVEAFFAEGEDSIRFSERLLESQKVTVVPGTPFGAPGFVRLSYATNEKTLIEGCHRILSFLESNEGQTGKI